MRNEHLKLAKQNELAAKYIFEFENNAIVMGLAPKDPFESIAEMNVKTCASHLDSLTKFATFPAMLADDALQMNRDFRRIYDEILAGRSASAKQFGKSSERIMSFDQLFGPNEGWKIFFSHFGDAKEN